MKTEQSKKMGEQEKDTCLHRSYAVWISFFSCWRENDLRQDSPKFSAGSGDTMTGWTIASRKYFPGNDECRCIRTEALEDGGKREEEEERGDMYFKGFVKGSCKGTWWVIHGLKSGKSTKDEIYYGQSSETH